MGAPRRLVSCLLLGALSSGVAGCISSQEAGRPFPAGARHELVIGRTSQQDAQELLGRPVTTAAMAGGQERWVYEHTRVSARRLVPWGRRVDVQQTPFEQLTLVFQSRVLKECLYVVERYRTDAGIIVAAGATREPCGR